MITSTVRFTATLVRPALHEVGEATILARGWRMITKIPHNLQYPLLLRRTLQAAWLPKEPLTGQFEHGVILRTRPLLKTRLHPF